MELEIVFWDQWKERFEDNYTEYITPYHPRVITAVKELNIDNTVSNHGIARSINSFIHNAIDYELSKKWKIPQETLSTKTGDCEDVTFLFSSMLLNYGIEHNLVIGDLVHNDGRQENHTWIQYEGTVYDGTGEREVIETLEYKPVEKYNMVIQA